MCKGEDVIWLGPTPLCWRPRNKRGQEVSSPHQAPQHEGHVWERRAPIIPGFETSRAYVWESWRTEGDQGSTLKGNMQKFTWYKSQCRGSTLKSVWVICKEDALANFRVCACVKDMLELFPDMEELVITSFRFFLFVFWFTFYLGGLLLVSIIFDSSHLTH